MLRLQPTFQDEMEIGMSDVVLIISAYQTELFRLLSEFVERALGVPATTFAATEDFDEKIRSGARNIGPRLPEALAWADRELRPFYAKKGIEIFRLASQLGGMKLVLGGSSRFQETQLASVRASLLYADTILIPDPVFPWLETERAEEKFRHVLMLKAAHTLLQLKPIVDAKLAHCPVLVFPSWEKSLEQHDAKTLSGTLQLLTDVFAIFVDPSIATPDDVTRLMRQQPARILDAVQQHRLFVAPGGPIGEPVGAALERYEDEMRTWRSDDWLNGFEALSPAEKIVNALIERLQSQYHLLENADELRAHPLLPIEQQAHYFTIVSQVNTERLVRLGLLDKQTKSLLAGMESRRLSFLSNVPVEALVEIRNNNENEIFRKRLKNAVGNLHDAALEDIDRTAAEICREIDSGIADHLRFVREIDDKYKTKMMQTAGAGIFTMVGLLWPSLAPFIGAGLPMAVATKFGWDAWEKSKEKRKISRSLFGVLATAKSSGSE